MATNVTPPKIESITIKPRVRVYTLPGYSIAVEANSADEAIAKAKKLKGNQ